MPFLEWLVDRDYTRSTIKRHFDNIWLLGGEIIRDLQWEERPLDLDFDIIVKEAVSDAGGPLLHGQRPDEDDQKKFDATCRKLHKYLEQGSLSSAANA